MLELFGLTAVRAKVNEAEAIREAQRRWLEAHCNTPEDESDRLVGKARGLFENTMPGEFGERMCDGTFVLGFRLWDFRHFPPRMKLGRKPAPWCPKPWSKSKGVRA